MPSKLTTKIFIERAIEKHGNTYDYSLVEYTSIFKKVKIICPVHGEFLQTANEHLTGYGCKLCGDARRRVKFKEKHGVDNPFNLQSSIDKRKQTWLDKYGVETPIKLEKVQNKRKQTWLDKYGVDNPAKNTGVANKRKNTMLQKYDTEHNSQVPHIHDAQQKCRSIEFMFPSGTSCYVQGYEPIVIQQLLDSGYKEDDLLLKNRPSIKYFWSSEDGYGDDKWHRYHPDIVIISEHKIIEVKSGWTYDGNSTLPKRLSQNIAKHNGAIAAGWAHQFIIIP